MDKMRHQEHTISVLSETSCVGVKATRSSFWHQFWALFNSLKFENFTNPLDHSSPLEAFGPTKDHFQSINKWGYNSLTITIHLDLIGFVPLSPTRRYSTFPHFEVLVFLSRMVSCGNYSRYWGDKSSIEGIWTFSPWSSIKGGSYNLKSSTLTTA